MCPGRPTHVESVRASRPLFLRQQKILRVHELSAQTTLNHRKNWNGTAIARVREALIQARRRKILGGKELLADVGYCAFAHDLIPRRWLQRTIAVGKDLRNVLKQIPESLNLQGGRLCVWGFVDLLVQEQTVQSGA